MSMYVYEGRVCVYMYMIGYMTRCIISKVYMGVACIYVVGEVIMLCKNMYL